MQIDPLDSMYSGAPMNAVLSLDYAELKPSVIARSGRPDSGTSHLAVHLESPAFKDEQTPYFGGQQANQILTAAAGQVSPDWTYLPYQLYANTVFGDTVGKSYAAGTALDPGLTDWQQALVDYGKEQGFTVNGG